MNKYTTGIFAMLLNLLLANPILYSQGEKIFWSEDFGSGKMPAGWKNVDMENRGCEWVVTDQPYPGSYLYQQQAPPIASSSRGFHLQFQAGWITDEDAPRWIKKGWYPDAYLQTGPIDCSKHRAVVLKFEHSFRWQKENAAPGYGIFAGVSTDSLHWTDFSLLGEAPAATDMFVPRKEVINISAVAAGKPRVFIRFYWKGMEAWYWMVDDISLSEPPDTDISLSGLTSYTESGNDFSKQEPFVVKIMNTGSTPIHKDFELHMFLDGKHESSQTIHAAQLPIAPFTGVNVTFTAQDLTSSPSHRLLFTANLPGDENPSNDSLSLKITAGATEMGNADALVRHRAG